MSKYHDDSTIASDPIEIGLSTEKLKRLQPELFGWRGFFQTLLRGSNGFSARRFREVIARHLRRGDSRAAVVCSTNPNLLVAAYTDEQDAVLILSFPQFLVNEYKLSPGSRLLTTNTYVLGTTMAHDIDPGPASTNRYSNFYPIIAEFLSDDLPIIIQRKREISDAEWQRAAKFASEKLSSPDLIPRNGCPMKSFVPA